MNANKAEIFLTAARLAGAREVLKLLTKAGTDREVGRKTLLLAFLLDPAAFGTQRNLARRLAVTEGRASQMLKVLRRHFQSNSPSWLTSVKE